MCIIASKKAGVELPSRQTLENCFMGNRDGIGFAFAMPGEKPVISKGFADVEKLIRMMETFNITKEHNLIIHFRLATHGATDRENCHPFPITRDYEAMRDLHCTADCAVAHNGIFSGMPKSEKYSDTMKFIGTILASKYVAEAIHTEPIQELVKGYCGFGSKLAFLTPVGITTIGNFYTSEGIDYSNYGYERYNYHTQSDYDWKDKSWKGHFGDTTNETKTEDTTKKVETDSKTTLLLDNYAGSRPITTRDAKGNLLLLCELCEQYRAAVAWNPDEDMLICPDCEVQLNIAELES